MTAPITPPTLDALPAYPDPNDRATFASRAFVWSQHLNVTFSPQIIALANNVYTNAEAAADSVADAAAQVALATAQVALATAQAAAAAGSAIAADASVAQAAAHTAAAAVAAAAPVWVSGSTVAAGDVRYSPISYHTYRRTDALPGASAVDPALDLTRWTQLSVPPGEFLIAAILLN